MAMCLRGGGGKTSPNKISKEFDPRWPRLTESFFLLLGGGSEKTLKKIQFPILKWDFGILSLHFVMHLETRSHAHKHAGYVHGWKDVLQDPSYSLFMLLLNVVDVSNQQISETKSCTYHTGTTEQSHVCAWNTALNSHFLVQSIAFTLFVYPSPLSNNGCLQTSQTIDVHHQVPRTLVTMKQISHGPLRPQNTEGFFMGHEFFLGTNQELKKGFGIRMKMDEVDDFILNGPKTKHKKKTVSKNSAQPQPLFVSWQLPKLRFLFHVFFFPKKNSHGQTWYLAPGQQSTSGCSRSCHGLKGKVDRAKCSASIWGRQPENNDDMGKAGIFWYFRRILLAIIYFGYNPPTHNALVANAGLGRNSLLKMS